MIARAVAILRSSLLAHTLFKIVISLTAEAPELPLVNLGKKPTCKESQLVAGVLALVPLMLAVERQ